MFLVIVYWLASGDCVVETAKEGGSLVRGWQQAVLICRTRNGDAAAKIRDVAAAVLKTNPRAALGNLDGFIPTVADHLDSTTRGDAELVIHQSAKESDRMWAIHHVSYLLVGRVYPIWCERPMTPLVALG